MPDAKKDLYISIQNIFLQASYRTTKSSNFQCHPNNSHRISPWLSDHFLQNWNKNALKTTKLKFMPIAAGISRKPSKK